MSHQSPATASDPARSGHPSVEDQLRATLVAIDRLRDVQTALHEALISAATRAEAERLAERLIADARAERSLTAGAVPATAPAATPAQHPGDAAEDAPAATEVRPDLWRELDAQRRQLADHEAELARLRRLVETDPASAAPATWLSRLRHRLAGR
jgi:hypothetical protein